MGKKGNRRTVLQLSDSKESFLARYGYRRQENDDEDSRGAYDPDDDSEEDLDKYAQESLEQSEENGQEVNGAPADIDHKVADFLAEIDALPAHEQEPEEEEEAPPSFKMEIPPPSFKLSADQQGHYQSPEEQPRPREVTDSKPKYKSMFVKGEVEFTQQTDTKLLKGVKEEEEPWPQEPKTVWQQTLDDNTQCYYYWNTVTNEVTWEIPSGYTQYLLMHKEYEATVDRLTKEGRVKPAEPKAPSNGVDSSVSDNPPTDKGDNSSVSSTSSLSVTSSKKTSILKNKEAAQPDSTVVKQKKPSLVDATYFDDSDEESSSSEDDKPAKPSKKQSDSDVDMDIDIDDIDKALEMALEKKKPGEKSSSSKESKSGGDKRKDHGRDKKSSKDVKQPSLVEEMKAQVQKRQELEARRKAAIEEMMARELERRVGPPRKRPSEEEPPETVWDSKRSKNADYSHSSRKSREHDHSSHRSSVEKDHHGDSKHKHDDRKAEKKRRKEEREERRRDREDKSDRKKDRDRSREKDKREKHKDEKKKDKKDKESKRDEKKSEKKEEKSEKKKEKSESVKEEEEKKEEVSKQEIKIEEPVVKSEVGGPVMAERDISREVQLANLKMQASELADLALSKLEFLEVTKKGLSKLQILLIELETRHQDWQGGGLNTEFFVTKLEEANWQLQQYEQSAAPPGWTCHWDRAYRRYFYMNKKSSRTQWDYPDDDDEDDGEEENAESDKEEKITERKREIDNPLKDREDDYPSSKGTSPEDGRSVASSSTSGRDVDQVSSTTAVHSDVIASADTTVSTARPKPSDSRVEDHHLPSSNQLPQPKSDQQLMRSTDYLGAQDMSCILRGEPPPPGTDLELLLTAPPPPPPPEGGSSASDSEDSADYETGRTYSDRVDREEDMEMDSNEATSSNVQTFSGPSDVGGTVFSQSDSAVSYMTSSNGVSGADAPAMIARAPQIFSSDTKSSGDGGYLEGVVDAGVVSGSFITSAGTDSGDGAWLGDSVSAQLTAEKEKKKKKKDKTISSTSLTLKKKNVSGLVQKWQKVKKEVEIEERNREEREMAIRQQLEELKQEYS